MKTIFSILFSFTIITTLYADPLSQPAEIFEPIAGIYDEGLIIAYNKNTQIISGYYENYSGWNEALKMPRFSCVFYLQANIQNIKTLNIKSWFPGNPDSDSVISGILSFSDKDKSLTIKLEKEHGGCWNVQHFVDEPVAFSLADKKNWIGFRITKSDRTYFYKQPDNDSRRRAYIIKGDLLKILKQKTDWIYAEYRNPDSGRITSGWIKISDVYSSELPVTITKQETQAAPIVEPDFDFLPK